VPVALALMAQPFSAMAQPTCSNCTVVWPIPKRPASMSFSWCRMPSLFDGGTSAISTWQLKARVLDPRHQMCKSCTSSTPSTARIELVTSLNWRPLGSPSSRMLSASRMMPQEVHTIKIPIRMESAESTWYQPV
jgi:hypothetical protein